MILPCPAQLKGWDTLDGLRTDWGLKIYEHLKEVVPMISGLGEFSTVVGFVSLIAVKLITSITASQLCGV